MSFYLLPAGSFQSQQKLKKKASDRKKDRESGSHRRLSSSNSAYSRMSLQSLDENSIVTSAASSIHDPSGKSLHSTKLRSTSVTGRKPSLGGSFNYTAHSDMKDVLESTKRRSSKHGSPSSSIHRSPSHVASSSIETLTHEMKEVKIDFRPVNYQPQNADEHETEQSLYEPKQDVQNLPELDDIASHLSGEEEVSEEISRVYSNVSSIFSTKKGSDPVSTKPRSKLSFLKRK